MAITAKSELKFSARLKTWRARFFPRAAGPRMRESSTEKILAAILLVFAIGFNLWIYRMEPTAKVDPNDNHFQFALVDRTNQIWNYAQQKCSSDSSGFFLHFTLCSKLYTLLFDHWVPNWAEGYNLPYYYSHIPQILIVATWRLFHIGSLFQYYHWVIYLLLSFFPLSVFLSLRVLQLSWLTAGFGALIASQISTDGFYGLDPSSFLWRGYGLSSQLFAMIWLPLAIAYAYRGKVLPAIFTLAATTAGHLGIGIIAFISIGILNVRKAIWILGGAFALLAYWIVPAYLANTYHAFSVWDPIWKFDSYGATEVLSRLFNGNLFDFGHFPILTILVFLGFFISLFSSPFALYSLLLLFWLLMYFGRTTWGPLMDMIPFMKEFHQSRFIVGVHLSGLFLIPIAFERIRTRFIKIIFVLMVFILVFPQTIRYAKHNDFLIARANADYQKIQSDVNTLLSTLYSLLSEAPGRVFAGRGGSWGKDFRVAETPYFMHLSTYGIPTVLWMPQTWSPNSDTEQFFRENKPEDYDLFNIRYVVSPPSVKPEPFWKFIKETKTWRLYEVETGGYITTGVRPAIVSSAKENFINLVHLWIQSDYPKQGLYPELTFDSQYPKDSGLPHFFMEDEVTYRVPDGTRHNLFSEIPVYNSPPPAGGPLITLTSQTSDSDIVFTANVNVPKGCSECLVILKQTFHPNWRVTVDGKPAEKIIVFPFYIATLIPEGNHEVVFSYQPSTLKTILLVFAIAGVVFTGTRLKLRKKR